jgi:hypothetical protein
MTDVLLAVKSASGGRRAPCSGAGCDRPSDACRRHRLGTECGGAGKSHMMHREIRTRVEGGKNGWRSYSVVRWRAYSLG